MPIKFDSSGAEKFKRKLEKLEGTKDIKLVELFTDSFMQQYTNFGTFQDMVNACGIEILKEQSEKLTQFIIANTRFKTWEEMLKTAHARYIKRQLST
jgi:hypothetical protein